MVCSICQSSLRQTVRPSVCLSVCLSVPAFASMFHHRLPWYFIRWLETPTAFGSQIFKVIWQILRSHSPKKLVKRVKSMVFVHFLENAWRKGLKYHMLLYPDHLIRFWSRSVDFTNFGGILTQWNISNVWFPYLMENAWQYWPEIWHADISWLPSELLRFGYGLLMFLIFNPVASACEQGVELTLQWRHNERNGVSNHRHLDCLLNRLFRRRSKKTSKLRVTGLCEGNSRVTGEFLAQRTSNAESVSIWWRHHDICAWMVKLQLRI